MPGEEKELIVRELKKFLSGSDTLFLVGYSGIGSNDMSRFRKNVKDAGGMVRVVKNRLVKIAVPDKLSAGVLDMISGQTAFVRTSGDPVLMAKVLTEFAGANKSFELKGGVVESSAVDKEEVRGIARLKGKDYSLVQLVGSLSFPIRRFLYLGRSLVGAFARSLACIIHTQRK